MGIISFFLFGFFCWGQGGRVAEPNLSTPGKKKKKKLAPFITHA